MAGPAGNRMLVLAGVFAALSGAGCARHAAVTSDRVGKGKVELVKSDEKVVSEAQAPEVRKSEEEWKQELTPEQYRVLRQAGTEAPFTGKYWNYHEDGTYTCAACGAELFRSKEKFDSGCGWPSFYEALDKSRIIEREDNSFGMRRIEVLCRKCGGHLGHVFEDGPAPTGLRYCINSASLNFEKKPDR